MTTKIIKATALGLLLFCICLSADVAYGLGGGGHHGDGRWDVPQPAASANSNPGTPEVQQAAGGPANHSVGTPSWAYSSFGAGFECVTIGAPFVQEPVTIPEPIAALLLGLGAIGLVSMRRKFSK